jgi:GTP-binding protein YchF
MEIGIVGLPASGKTTIFNALTGSEAEVSAFKGGKKDPNLAVVKVPDPRLQALSEMYKPKKTTPAQVRYVDIGGTVSARDGESSSMDELLRLLRPVDALINVVRNFEFAGEAPSPQDDFDALESELVFSDLMTVEKRVEKLEKEITKAKKGNPQELELLKKAQEILDSGKALRTFPEIASDPLLRGYAFLSAKPCIVVLNSDDDAELGACTLELPEGVTMLEIKGRIEMELAQLSDDEAELFREDMGLEEPATNMLIRKSYEFLGLISFFTVGPDEVKAWTLKKNTPAPKAAGVIHSDIEKGFIRAEVVSYGHLMEAGSHSAAQKAGHVRLEGKDYIVQDGDVINFRFNV